MKRVFARTPETDLDMQQTFQWRAKKCYHNFAFAFEFGFPKGEKIKVQAEKNILTTFIQRF